MTEFGKTPYYTADEFQMLGCSMVIYPVTSLRAAAKAYERVFAEIFEKGTQKGVLDDMQTREELYDAIQYYDYEKLDENIAKTVLPENRKRNIVNTRKKAAELSAAFSIYSNCINVPPAAPAATMIHGGELPVDKQAE